ncbi:NHL repeat-containing protein [Nocardia arthritidis]|uniref:SMP-30/Gluconolactonase/LRE-like region domain-containing protein n=1 Tax=Nocardia arthritidis TaxID=228602 RepID=A0A6G9YTF7_9NOCA|nr:NHL repeat-containing protein [Nocardia arthritidis]QIS16484.1 hypothetical protein F5544_43395 [Nocardia arthritidis]
MAPDGTVSEVPFKYGVSNPTALAVNPEGTVYVAKTLDGPSPRIYTMSVNGTQSYIDVPELHAPTDLRFDSVGNLYVVDSWNNRIVRIKPGGIQETIPPGNLDRPYAVHVDAVGTITVSNRAPGAGITRYTAAGVQTTIPLTGLDEPTGLDYDMDGNLYVAQSGTGPLGPRVIKYTPDGVQSNVAFPLNSPDALYKPMGICVRDGFLYVADQVYGILKQAI